MTHHDTRALNLQTLTLTLTLPAAMMAKDAAYLLLESEESANYKGRRQPPTVVEKDGGCQSAGGGGGAREAGDAGERGTRAYIYTYRAKHKDLSAKAPLTSKAGDSLTSPRGHD